MKKEEKTLIELCKAYLYGSSIRLNDDTDYYCLYKCAVNHNLAAICYCAIAKAENREIIPEKCLAAFKDKFLDCICLYEVQSRCINDLEMLLSSSHTRYILFKGARLKELYPVPESRAMGDIDILINKNDRDKVKKLLTGSGFECTAQNGPVFDYRKDSLIVEVHTRILNEKGMESFPAPFNDYAEFDGCCGTLDDSYHFAYLIAHTAHHFKFYGAGIKLILDLAVMQQKCRIDYNKVMNILSSINLETFAKVILSVCHKWFGIGANYKKSTQKTEEFLCSYGAFGITGRNKGAVITRKELEKGKAVSPIRVRLALAFPPYSKMKEIPYIRFIDGRPWLTPYAWCYRFFYNIKNRKEFMTSTVNSIGDEKTVSQAKEELEYFKEIGLL